MHTSHFIASTGEAGDPSDLVNPHAPSESRAAGDSYVHYVEDSCADETLIRFWFPEKSSGTALPVDFEILKPVASWLRDEPLRLTPEVAIKLITMIFFQELTQDFYKKTVEVLSFQEVGKSRIFDVPYPQVQISKHEIA